LGIHVSDHPVVDFILILSPISFWVFQADAYSTGFPSIMPYVFLVSPHRSYISLS